MNKETLSVVLSEYKILWDYYNTTLAERKNIYDWYFKIVALPATVVSVLFNSDYIDLTNKNINFFLYGFYGVIFLAGISMFVAYTFESAVSVKYYSDINNMRKLLIKAVNKKNRSYFYIIENYERKATILSTKFFKSLTVPIINAGIGLVLLNNIHIWNIPYNILFYTAILFCHALLYKAIFNHHSK